MIKESGQLIWMKQSCAYERNGVAWHENATSNVLRISFLWNIHTDLLAVVKESLSVQMHDHHGGDVEGGS